MIVSFYKYHGAGNDFVLIDNRDFCYSLSNEQIKKLCHRKYSIGADGVIFLLKSKRCDFKAQIFNSDGIEADMCGNAVLCLLNYLKKNFPKKDEFIIETKKFDVFGFFKNEKINFKIESALILNKNISIHEMNFFLLDTGVLHAVCFVDDLNALDVDKQGKEIRHHEYFYPTGVNVNFVKLNDDNSVNVRTFEKGVEKETYACGTGAIASAIASSYKDKNSPVKVVFKGGEYIISFEKDNDIISEIVLSGSSELSYQGIINI